MATMKKPKKITASKMKTPKKAMMAKKMGIKY